jgi:uncharacterized membrane protein YhhN
MWLPIVLAGAMLCWLPFCIWTAYHWKPSNYLISKTICSTLFVLTGLASLLFIDIPNRYAIMIMVALILGWIGDVFLVYYQTPKWFITGLVSFLVGQIIYGSAFISYIGVSWFDVAIYFGILSIAMLIYPKTNLMLKKMKIPDFAYVLIVLFMFTAAISSLYKSGINSTTTMLIAFGGLLFIISDLILAFVLFDKTASKSLTAFNLAFYYSAQVLLALSILTFAL